MNYTYSKTKLQAWHEKSLHMPQFVEKDLRQFLLTKLPTFLSVLNVLLYYSNNYVIVCPSAQNIAKRVGISKRHVFRILDKLEGYGLISRCRRHNDSNLYKFNDVFFQKYMREHLEDILYSLRYSFVKQFTHSIYQPYKKIKKFLSEYVPLYLNVVNLKTKSLSKYRESTNDEPIYQVPNKKVICVGEEASKITGALRPKEPKKGKVMNVFNKAPIDSPMKDSEILLKIKNLTSSNLWGQIIMSAFDPRALTPAIKKMESGKGIGSDPFTVLFRNCVLYSNAKKLPINYFKVWSLAKKHNMPNEPNYADGRDRRIDDVRIDSYWKDNEEEV